MKGSLRRFVRKPGFWLWRVGNRVHFKVMWKVSKRYRVDASMRWYINQLGLGLGRDHETGERRALSTAGAIPKAIAKEMGG